MHTYKGAVIGLALGVAAATALYGRKPTIGVWFWYGSVDVIAPLMIPAVLPFNLIKTVLNGVDIGGCTRRSPTSSHPRRTRSKAAHD